NDGWRTAMDLTSAGIKVEAIVDTRSEVMPVLLDAAKSVGVRTMLDAQVIETHGGRMLTSATVRDHMGRIEKFSTDLLCMSGGWNPSLGLTTHLGNRPRWSEELRTFVPANARKGMILVGAARGSFALGDCIREGMVAGAEAAESLGYRTP